MLAFLVVIILGLECSAQELRAISSESGSTSSLLVVFPYDRCDIQSQQETFLENVVIAFGAKAGCLVFSDYVFSDAIPGDGVCPEPQPLEAEGLESFSISLARSNLLGANEEALEFRSLIPELSDANVQQVMSLAWHKTLIDKEFQEKVWSQAFGVDSSQRVAFDYMIKTDIENGFISNNLNNSLEVWKPIVESVLQNQELLDTILLLAAKWRVFDHLFHKALLEQKYDQVMDSLFNTSNDFPKYQMTQKTVYTYEQKIKSLRKIDLEVYVQDHVIGFTDGSSPFLIPRFEPNDRVFGNMLVTTDYIADSCGYDRTNSQNLMLDLQGGNLFVLDDLAIIGKDELYRKYTDTSNLKVRKRIEALGLEADQPFLGDSVKSRIARKLGVRDLFWFGVDEKVYCTEKNDSFYQPFYHLDVFFHPIRVERKRNAKRLKCLIGRPDPDQIIFPSYWDEKKRKKHTPSCKRTLQSVNLNIDIALSDLKETLKVKGITLCPIEIPIVCKMDSDSAIKRLTPYCNGLIDFDDKSSTYYLPVRSKVENEIIRKTTKKLLKEFDYVLPVQGNYSAISGLRCRAIPLMRH